jgi:hypothetical protein
LLGGARQQGNAELRLLDDLSLVGEAERLVRGQDTDQENLLRGKLQIKYRWRLR